MKHRSTNLVAFILVLVTGCTTTTPVSEWRDPAYQGGPVNNILVIGVTRLATERRLFEDEFVSELGKLKVNAVASHTIMDTEKKISKESVVAAIQGKNIDAVLVTHLVGVDTRESYTPPSYRPAFYGGYYGYYSHAFSYVYEPGYYTRYKVLQLETRLYEVKSEKMIWSTLSETIDPNNAAKVAKSKIGSVIGQLQKQKLLGG